MKHVHATTKIRPAAAAGDFDISGILGSLGSILNIVLLILRFTGKVPV